MGTRAANLTTAKPSHLSYDMPMTAINKYNTERQLRRFLAHVC